MSTKNLLVLFLFHLCFILKSYAHNANEAFFEIHIKNNNTIVTAEFPWTLRNALYQFNPSLQKATDKSEFEASFFDYIKTNLHLTDDFGVPLQLEQIIELPQTGHSHQGTYEIVYHGNTFSGIKNTSQFALYPNQINYHKVFLYDKVLEFNTTNESPSFELSQIALNAKNSLSIEIIASILICILAIFFLLKMKSSP